MYIQMPSREVGQFPMFDHRTPTHHNIQTRPLNHIMDENIPPSGYRHLTDVEVMKCLTLAECGKTQRAIAAEVKCTKSTVGRVLRDYNYETFTQRKPHPGPARITSKRDDMHLVVTAKRNYDRSLADITNIAGLSISPSTVARRLAEVKLFSRYKRRKPFLSSGHKKARLEWANTYKDWTVEEWKKVIFSDECLMRIGVDPTRQRVIRPNGTALEERYLMPTFKSGRVTIMIWACFSGDRVGPILTLEQGGIGSDEYEEILYEGLLPMIDDILAPPENTDTIQVADENTFLFMHDNAPCHKTSAITNLLTDHHIPVMKWPAQSPDLNPIENLWRDLKARFYIKFRESFRTPSASYDSIEQYKSMIEECWYEQNRDFIQTLIESMPRRCAAVIAAKGGHIKY
jgi:transposase